MKILVFDDTEAHRKSAEATIKGHDLMVVGTYDEAQKALIPQTDHKLVESIRADLLKEAGIKPGFDPWGKDKGASEEEKERFFKIGPLAVEKATTQLHFDVVLTDLLVPASDQAQGRDSRALVGKEMPLGTTIALLALVVGTKNVAVVTDMNHHDHPASAAFDCFGAHRLSPNGKGNIPGVNIICTNGVNKVSMDAETGQVVTPEFLESKEGQEKHPYLPGRGIERKGLVRGKDWGSILKYLLGEEEEEEQPIVRIL